MIKPLPKTLSVDPRYFQIFSLSVLVVLQMFWADFGPLPQIVAVNVVAALLTQYIFSRVLNIGFDPRSPLITALSLSMLLKASVFWVYPLAAFVAIASKFTLRMDGRHIFNPANGTIVLMLLLLPGASWVSPGQWGSLVWLGFLLICLGTLVLYKIPRRDITLMFLGIWVFLIFGRALWLGDPLSIPVHQLQNGALLIFAFFMISDPKTVPDHVRGRFVFALAVCLIAFIMQFEFQISAALFYALALVCLVRPAIDKVWRGTPYAWK